MYLRTKTFKNKDGSTREYLYVVESRRISGKMKQIVVATLGRLDVIKERESIEKLSEKLSQFLNRSKLIDLAADIKAEWSKEYGIIAVLRQAWEKIGFGEMLRRYRREKSQKDFAETTFMLVANRLLDPRSELGILRWKEGVYEPEWDKIKYQDLYRSLDFLVERKEECEIEIFQRTSNLFNQKLDIILFDTTSIKYWGEGKTDLLKHGYSKEKRGDLKQLVVGILMSKEGIPVGHEVWPGNMSDMKAILEMLNKVKGKFQIDKVVWVCDRGMVSEGNLKELQKAGHEYIVGIKMRQLPADRRSRYLDTQDMIQVRHDLFVKEVKENGEGRYIICYNPVEAHFESGKREYFRKILQNKIDFLSGKEWIIKNGYRKYLDVDAHVSLDEERLNKERIFDGKWVLLTNTEYPIKEVALYYKSLWQIEQGFRDLKHELEANPIYHYTEKRIRAHIFVCFLALAVRLSFKKWLRQLDNKASCSEVFEALKGIKAIQICAPNQKIIMRTEFPAKAHLGFRAAGLAPPPRILELHPKEKGVMPT